MSKITRSDVKQLINLSYKKPTDLDLRFRSDKPFALYYI